MCLYCDIDRSPMTSSTTHLLDLLGCRPATLDDDDLLPSAVHSRKPLKHIHVASDADELFTTEAHDHIKPAMSSAAKLSGPRMSCEFFSPGSVHVTALSILARCPLTLPLSPVAAQIHRFLQRRHSSL